MRKTCILWLFDGEAIINYLLRVGASIPPELIGVSQSKLRNRPQGWTIDCMVICSQ